MRCLSILQRSGIRHKENRGAGASPDGSRPCAVLNGRRSTSCTCGRCRRGRDRCGPPWRALQARAQVVEARFAVRRPAEAVLRASAVAHGEHLAFPAEAGERVPLCVAERALRAALQQTGQRGLENVTQPVRAIHVVIARKEVAVVLEDGYVAAGFAKYAQRMLHSQRGPSGFVESLHGYAADVASDPLVEHSAKERPVILRRWRVRGDFASRAGRALHNGQEADVSAANIPKEAVHAERGAHVKRMNHADDIGVDVVLAEQFIAAHGRGVTGPAATGDAIGVVQFRRPVEAEAHAEVLGLEETAPLVVEEHSVGLDAVADAPAGGAVPALDLEDLAKELHAEDGGLSAVP